VLLSHADLGRSPSALSSRGAHRMRAPLARAPWLWSRSRRGASRGRLSLG